MIKLPEHTQKRIYWNKDSTGGVACILVGYCPDTLAYFRAMFKLAKKSFPDLIEEECTCGKVSRSSSIQGFTLLLFHLESRKFEIDGWDNFGPIDFNY